MLLKFCGMTRQEDLYTASRLGAHWCGFIFHESSPRHVSPQNAALLESVNLKRVGVFVRQGLDEIRAIMHEARLDYAQLHGEQSVACAQALGASRVIRVLWPTRYDSPAALQEAMLRFAPTCAFYLLDAGKQGGGKGITLNWEVLALVRPPHPWLLAGGLCAANVVTAIRACHPGGVDFNSGVEDAPGRKNSQAMEAAVAAITSV